MGKIEKTVNADFAAGCKDDRSEVKESRQGSLERTRREMPNKARSLRMESWHWSPMLTVARCSGGNDGAGGA